MIIALDAAGKLRRRILKYFEVWWFEVHVMYCKVWHVCRWVLSRGSYNGVSAYPVRPTFPGASSNKIQLQIQLEVQIHSQIQIRDNEVFFYPMSTAFLEAKYKYLLLTEVAGLARLQWIRTIQDFSNLYRFQMLNSRSYESWFVWRMANRSDEQVWIREAVL